eukprot:8319309-Pyramimonas_sp.AAC.1
MSVPHRLPRAHGPVQETSSTSAPAQPSSSPEKTWCAISGEHGQSRQEREFKRALSFQRQMALDSQIRDTDRTIVIYGTNTVPVPIQNQ